MQWLDDKWQRSNGSSSVIYVSFGTLAQLASEQILQIADALSPYPVIWFLKSKFQTNLASSFKENKLHLILDWTPQRLILLHPAVRLFITHGGWNSLLEGMLAGKPILAWPTFGDQFLNGKRLEEELKIGRMIKATSFGNNQRIITAEELTKYLNEVFDQEKIYLENAEAVKRILINAKENSSRKYIEEFIHLIDGTIHAPIKRMEEL